MLNSLASSIFWGRSHENALAFQAVATYMIIATIFMTAGPKGERSDDKVGPKTLTDVVNATERITRNQVGPSNLSTEVQYDSRFTNTPRPSLHLPRYFTTDLLFISRLQQSKQLQVPIPAIIIKVAVFYVKLPTCLPRPAVLLTPFRVLSVIVFSMSPPYPSPLSVLLSF